MDLPTIIIVSIAMLFTFAFSYGAYKLNSLSKDLL